MEFNSFGPAVGRLGSDSSKGGAKLRQSRSRGLSPPPSPPHFNHWLYYNLLLCFIPLEMHVRLICAIKFYLLTYLLTYLIWQEQLAVSICWYLTDTDTDALLLSLLLETCLRDLFNGPLSRTTRVSRYQKGKPIWILLKQEIVSGSGISWAVCKSASRSRQ